jgi:hypothetical protein
VLDLREKAKMKNLFNLLIITLLSHFSSELSAQCTFGGTWFADNITPTVEGETVSIYTATGGDQFTLNVSEGCNYTVSTCGSTWNTRLTVFDENQAVVAHNNDYCGYQAQVTFTADSPGPFIVQLNRQNCGSNSTNATLSVTLNYCVEILGCPDPNSCNYNLSATDISQAYCCYDYCATLQMFDSGNDGWNGATYTLYDSFGNVEASGTLQNGGYGLAQFCLTAGCYFIEIDGGISPSEISWTLSTSGLGLVTEEANRSLYFSVGPGVCGCTDPAACNFDPNATIDNNTCCASACATITVGGGSNDGQISWELIQGVDEVAGGGENLASPLEICLDGCYTLNLYDSGGNGWEGATILIEDQYGQILFVGSLSGFSAFSTFNICSENPQDFGCENVSPPGCPDIYAGEDVAVECAMPTVNLLAQVFETGESNTYFVESIPYAPPIPYSDGVSVSIGVDDVWSYEIPLPFDFCFFGDTYSRMIVGSNALISFDVTKALEFCPWSYTATVPNPVLPTNAIFGPYHDIDPSVCGTVSYSICGAEPCRFAVINFNDVCHYQCTSIKSSCQIVIYETTNVIEIYIGDKPTCGTWNLGNAVVGIQNFDATAGFVAPGSQTGPWTASNEAWRFVPGGIPNYSVKWYHDNVEMATGIGLTVEATEDPETYIAEATYINCNGDSVIVSDDVVVQCFAFLLPIELLSFDAEVKGKQVVCKWVTATELNNEYFTVEHSQDLQHWQELGEIPGAGTTLEEKRYSYVDKDPLEGISYYRIRQTDYNGDYSHSWNRAVNLEFSFGSYVYPNPNKGLFSVDAVLEGLELVIHDTRGRSIPFDIHYPNSIQMRELVRGVYLLEAKDASGSLMFRERFVIE